MSIIPEQSYVGKITEASEDYPYGSARNITTPGDGTGTPLEQAWLNDDWGFKQALLKAGNVVPSGVPDTAVVSQYMQALSSYVDTKISKKSSYTHLADFLPKEGAVDDYWQFLQDALDATPAKGTLILEPGKEYYSSQMLTHDESIIVLGNGSKILSDAEKAIEMKGSLKTTKSVTVDYVKGAVDLTLSDVTDVAVGDLLNVVSTDLFDYGRDYYYLGGNVLVTKIDGNKVTLSMPFPFDMTASTLTIKVYDPITVVLHDLDVTGAGVLPANRTGVHVYYGKNCVFSKMEMDNFCANIQYDRLVNTISTQVNTRRAKTLRSDKWDGYGHAIYSCTNILIESSTCRSGQHAITWGGREVNFNISIERCVLDFEMPDSISLGTHSNAYNVSVRDSTLYGFSASGNFTMENCDVYQGNSANVSMPISPSHDPDRANFTFKNVRFHGIELSCRVYYRDAPYDMVTNSITLENCNGIDMIRAGIRQREPELRHTINTISVKNCDLVRMYLFDNVRNIIVDTMDFARDLDGGHNTPIDKVFISQQVVAGKQHGRVGNISIRNAVIPNRVSSISLANAGLISMDNVRFDDWLTGPDTNGGLGLSNVDVVKISNSDLETNAFRGSEFTNIGELEVMNSKIKFRFGPRGSGAVKEAALLTAVNMKADGEMLNAFTTPLGVRFLQTYAEDGSVVNEALDVAPTP